MENEKPSEPPSYRSLEEAQKIVRNLSENEYKYLARAAAWLLSPYAWLPLAYNFKDLLHEACIRTLTGERRMPCDISPPRFLIETMRSIHSSWSKTASRIDIESIDPQPRNDPDIPVPEVETLRTIEPDPETRMMIALRIQRVFSALEHDKIAWHVAKCWGQQRSAKETQEALGISPNEYDAARKRIIRSLRAIEVGKP